MEAVARHEPLDPRSTRAKRIRRLANRSFRERERCFVAEGPQALDAALSVAGGVVEMVVTPEAEERHTELLRRAQGLGVPILVTTDRLMAQFAQTVTPQGVLGVCRFLDVDVRDVAGPRPALVSVLAEVRDPGNAGTVVRTADAAGADAVVFTDASVDPYNGKCVRASAGSLFHLPIVTGVPTRNAIDALRDAGLTVIAADGHAIRTIDDVADEGLLSGRTAWIFGNEASGLPGEALQLADEAARVPLHGRAESLNLATAAAVCLYASARAQRVPGGCRSPGASR